VPTLPKVLRQAAWWIELTVSADLVGGVLNGDSAVDPAVSIVSHACVDRIVARSDCMFVCGTTSKVHVISPAAVIPRDEIPTRDSRSCGASRVAATATVAIMAAMLELFLTLGDRFIDVVKSREESNAKRFSLVKDMYAELERVHADYLQMFDRVAAGAADGEDVEALKRALSSDRLVFEAGREKMRAAVRVLSQDATLRSYRDFFGAVLAYFMVVDPIRNLPAASSRYVLGALNRMSGAEACRNSVIVGLVKAALVHSRNNWAHVRATYAALLAKSV
jgi:hypothetical protein